jgi:DNA-binding response OmpR family regulator
MHSAEKAQLMSAGMDDVIVKPLDPQQLSKTIQNLISTSQTLDKSAVA